MPTPMDSPWPSDPVAASAYGNDGTGWPSSTLPNFRNVTSSFSLTRPAAAHSAYSSGAAGPLEKRGRSLLGRAGWSASKRNTPENSKPTVSSAADSDELGCPDPAAVVDFKM